jgi:hypothetical protein
MGRRIETWLMADVRLDTGTPVEETTALQPPRLVGIVLVLLGLGVAASALLGPLVLDVLHYHASPGAIDHVRGGDVAALLLVAPTALLAGILTLRGRMSGLVLGMGPTIFTAYIYPQLAVGGEFLRYEGNSEQFFLLNLGLFVLGLLGAVGCWASVDVDQLPRTSRRFDKFLIGFLTVAALFLVVGLHLPGLLAIWAGSPTEEYLADPALFWIVKLMDLGIIVPVMVGVAVGLARSWPWADKAKYAAVGWFALLGSAVAGMAITMQLTAAPGASIGLVVGFGLIALAGLALAWALYRPLLTTSR